MIVAPIVSTGLAFGLMAFCFKPPFLGAPTGFGWPPLSLGLQNNLQPFRQPTKSNVPIPTLGPALVCRDTDTTPKCRRENLALRVGERSTLLDFEHQFGTSIRGVGMLATGTPRGTETPLKFIVGNREVGIDLQRHEICPVSKVVPGGSGECAGTLCRPNQE